MKTKKTKQCEKESKKKHLVFPLTSVFFFSLTLCIYIFLLRAFISVPSYSFWLLSIFFLLFSFFFCSYFLFVLIFIKTSCTTYTKHYMYLVSKVHDCVTIFRISYFSLSFGCLSVCLLFSRHINLFFSFFYFLVFTLILPFAFFLFLNRFLFLC